MITTNLITKSVFEILGDKTSVGYSFQGVPLLLNKDPTTQYPEIRVSPFVAKNSITDQKYIEKTYQSYRHWESGTFQIDIYTRDIIEAQNIYDELIERIYDFFNLETLVYNWNFEFKQIDDFIFKNKAYALDKKLFKEVYSCVLEGQKLKRVYDYDLLEYDTYYIDKDALYICSKRNLKSLELKVLIQGRLFENGDAYSDRGIHYYELSDQRNLSALEGNEVERISFDMSIIFSYKREREPLPVVNNIRLPKPKIR